MKAIDIKLKRKALGYTQKKLSELVGVSVQTINGYENGKEIPKTKYQILEKVLAGEISNIIHEPEPEYKILEGYDQQIKKIKEKINEHEKIITLAKNNPSLISHHTEMIKLLNTQIEIIKEANNNHILDK